MASLVDIARQQFTAGQQRLLQAMEGMQAGASSSNGTHAEAAAATSSSAAAGSMAGSMQASSSSSPSAAEGVSMAGPETDLQQLLGVAGELGMAENDLQRCLQEQARMLKEANASLRGTARQEHEAR